MTESLVFVTTAARAQALLTQAQQVLHSDNTDTCSVAQTAPSPCVQVCQLDAQQRYCVGCLRSLAELGEWSRASDARKQDIWQAIAGRAAALV